MTPLLFAATTPERSTIEERYKWDLTPMYASADAWNAHHQQLEAMIAEFAGRKGVIGKSAADLLAALKHRDQINIQLEKLSAYAAMRKDEDMRQPGAQAVAQRAQTLAVKYDEAASWFQPELLQIPEARLREWLAQADLKVYAHYFD